MGTAFLTRMQPFMLDKTCLICRKPFVNRVALEQHMITKHIEVTEQQAQQLRRNLRKGDNSDLSEQKECILCLKTFHTNDALRQHYESKHPGKDPDSTKKVYAGTSQVGSAFVEGGFNEDIFHKDLSDSDDDGPPRVVAVVSSNASSSDFFNAPLPASVKPVVPAGFAAVPETAAAPGRPAPVSSVVVDTSADDDDNDIFSGRRMTSMTFGTTHVWSDTLKTGAPTSGSAAPQIDRSRTDEINDRYMKTVASYRETHDPKRYASSAVVDLPDDDDFSSDPLHGRTVGLQGQWGFQKPLETSSTAEFPTLGGPSRRAPTSQGAGPAWGSTAAAKAAPAPAWPQVAAPAPAPAPAAAPAWKAPPAAAAPRSQPPPAQPATAPSAAWPKAPPAAAVPQQQQQQQQQWSAPAPVAPSPSARPRLPRPVQLSAPTAPAWLPGDLCEGRFTEDGQWYRARIDAVAKEGNMYLVTYVDYGNREILGPESLRPPTN